GRAVRRVAGRHGRRGAARARAGLRRAPGRAGVEGCRPGGRRPGRLRADRDGSGAGGAGGDPGAGRGRGRRAVDRPVAAHAGGRLPRTGRRPAGEPALSAHLARAGAVTRKELAELRRNRLIVVTAVMLPVIFLIGPTVTILSIKGPALSATL